MGKIPDNPGFPVKARSYSPFERHTAGGTRLAAALRVAPEPTGHHEGDAVAAECLFFLAELLWGSKYRL